jgi:hypothetical protein
LKSYWEDPTMYKKVPEFLPGHNHRGKRQTPEHLARRAKAIRETLRQKRSKLIAGDKKNPPTKRGRYSPV